MVTRLMESFHTSKLDASSTVEQEYSRLHRAVFGTAERPGLVHLLSAIERDCHQTLLTRHTLCEASKVRKPDTTKLVRAFSLPGNILADGVLKNMFDISFEPSLDTYENRLVKAYVLAIQSRISWLQAALEAAGSSPTDDMEKTFTLFNQACLRATFLRRVKLPRLSELHMTMPLLKKPAYRSVLEGYLEFLKKSSVKLEERGLE